MRVRGWIVAIVVTAGALFALPAGAEEEKQAASGEKVYADSLGILRARLEALVKKAALLEKQGEFAAALRTYGEVEEVYEQVFRDLRRLAAEFRTPAPKGPTKPRALGPNDVPFQDPAKILPHHPPGGIGGGAGGAFQGRGGKARTDASKTRRTENAVQAALHWLKAHQSPNGAFQAADFNQWCDTNPVADAASRPDGLGKSQYDVGTTGLALCAFLGAGYTNRGNHPFKKTVSKGLRYLKNVQDPEGCFGPRAAPQYMYNHATASLAMVEAYGMTASPIFKGAAQRALEFHALSRNPYFAWRYGVKPGDNDTSVTAWMFMGLKSGMLINESALASGKAAPLVVDSSAADGVRAWLEKMTDPDYGRVGYISRGSGSARPRELVDRFPAEQSEAMTAAAIFMRTMLGEDPRKSVPIKLGAQLMQKLPPVWNPASGQIDMAYWYFGTMAAFQVGGKTWRTWSQAMDKAIVATQRMDGDACGYKGSWDPIGPWGIDGGRVYSTAMMALCCEVFYRYERVFGNPAKPAVTGGSGGWNPK